MNEVKQKRNRRDDVVELIECKSKHSKEIFSQVNNVTRVRRMQLVTEKLQNSWHIFALIVCSDYMAAL